MMQPAEPKIQKPMVAGSSDIGKVREKNEDHFLMQSLVENRGVLVLQIDATFLRFENDGLL